MKREQFSIAVLLVCLLFASLFVITSSFATELFELSYSIIEGGYRLELTEANPYKGVKLEVNSNVSCRYEIIQKILVPLENRDRPGVVIRDNFVFRGIRGSNRLGDLRVPANDSPVRYDEVVYVSDTAGTSDSFTLVFGIDSMEDIEPGNYFGRLGFILTPLASSRPQVTKILEVYVNIPQVSGIKPSLEISTATGLKHILLNPKKEETQSADVLVKINGRFNRQFSIIQFLIHPFESEEGRRLDYGVLSFIVKEAKKGLSESKVTPLSAGLQNIYTSLPSGESDDYFIVSYGLEDISGQRAGRYRSRIQYLLEEMGMQSKLETLEIEIENERIFDLQITFLDQRYGIEFHNVKPTEPPRRSEVIIEVNTNIGKRYQVNQEVYSELTNKEGKIIPPKYFTLQTENMDTKGKLNFTDKQEVRKGSTILFVSDSAGSPDKFKVIYELECPKDLQAGDYSTRVIYTLLEV